MTAAICSIPLHSSWFWMQNESSVNSPEGFRLITLYLHWPLIFLYLQLEEMPCILSSAIAQ